MRLSACIIARDEAARLPGCLERLDFCDEVVLVDSGSSDDTVAIAQAAGARVLTNPWPGFAAQRNFAIAQARGEWVLEVDADERVTAELAREIVEFLDGEHAAAFDIGALPLRNIFLGRALGPSAKYPEYRRRLFRRERYRHDERRTVHEALIPQGPIHPFEHDLEHLLAAGLGEALGDAWRYGRLEAGQMQLQGGLGAFTRGALVRPAAKLPYRLLVDGGWRDGWRGVLKVGIDCAVDSVVWWRHLLGRRGEVRGVSGVARSHYGATNFRAGAVRIVGLASGAAATARALEWLGEAARAGADVALIGESRVGADVAGTEVVRVRLAGAQLGPLRTIRALDAEQQLRTIDAVVPFGRRARTLLALVPPTLSPQLCPVTEDSEPAEACARLQAVAAGGSRQGDAETRAALLAGPPALGGK